MIKVKVPNSAGNISTIGIEMDNPKIKFDPISFNKINLFIGVNGLGKSFVLISTWYLSTILQNYIISRKMGATYDLKAASQWVWDRTFSDPDKMTGKLEATYEYGATITVEIAKGVITRCDINLANAITEPTRVNFMSKNMRTFDSMTLYLKLRRTVMTQNIDQIVDEMCKHFKLFDVMAVEYLIQRMPITVDPQLEARIHNFDDKLHIASFEVDIPNCIFYSVDKQSNKKNMTTYGAGHQSLLNMLIVNS
jgi:hypothetical protein